MFEDELKPGYDLRTLGTPVADGQGGYTQSHTDWPFNGAIRMLSANESLAYNRKGLKASHRIYAKPGLPTITRDSKIAFEGMVFEVVFWNDVMRAGELMQIDVELNE